MVQKFGIVKLRAMEGGIDCQDAEGRITLSYPAERQYKNVMEFLVNMGADKESQDDKKGLSDMGCQKSECPRSRIFTWARHGSRRITLARHHYLLLLNEPP